jgi:GntR family transcriptional repressor for pyruvate dehydrogenase complex
MNDAKRDLIKRVYIALQAGEITKNDMLLPERELAEYFQVKRSYLREVLIALEALGVIDIRERQGMFLGGKGTQNVLDSLNLLNVWPGDAIAQVFELRTMIEGPTAAFAALRRNERNIAKIQNALDQLASLRERKHPQIGTLGVQYNAILHTAIVEAAHNPVLLRVYEGTSRLYTEGIISVGSSEREKLPYEKWPEQVFQEHFDIVQAIRRGDPEEARARAILHLENSRNRIQSGISDGGKSA